MGENMEWQEWAGGECPTEFGQRVRVRYADKTEHDLEDGSHASWAWYDGADLDRVIAYKILSDA